MINKLNLKSNDVNFEYEDTNIRKIDKPKRFLEKIDTKQSHLFMGYRTDITYRHDLYPAYVLFCMMFGENSFSTLFNKVREELGLAYSIYASSSPIRNICLVYAGIDTSNVNLTIKAIKECLNSYNDENIEKNKQYFEILLNEAKNEFKNEYINSLDSEEFMVSDNLKRKLTNRRTLFELYKDSLKVTLEDIGKIKDHLWLDTIYVLKGMGEKDE